MIRAFNWWISIYVTALVVLFNFIRTMTTHTCITHVLSPWVWLTISIPNSNRSWTIERRAALVWSRCSTMMCDFANTCQSVWDIHVCVSLVCGAVCASYECECSAVDTQIRGATEAHIYMASGGKVEWTNCMQESKFKDLVWNNLRNAQFDMKCGGNIGGHNAFATSNISHLQIGSPPIQVSPPCCRCTSPLCRYFRCKICIGALGWCVTGLFSFGVLFLCIRSLPQTHSFFECAFFGRCRCQMNLHTHARAHLTFGERFNAGIVHRTTSAYRLPLTGEVICECVRVEKCSYIILCLICVHNEVHKHSINILPFIHYMRAW